MTGKGCITCHAILDTVLGEGKSWGCNVGRIRPTPFTFSSMMTAGGRLKFYVGEGQFTEDPVPDDFFGCAGVAEIPNLEDVLLHVARNGHRHHVSVAPGHTGTALGEALENYLDCDVTFAQRP
jgi:L-fucose isomerase-like protein